MESFDLCCLPQPTMRQAGGSAPMPTLDWLRKEYRDGYDSGNVLSLFPNRVRRQEEQVIGGSYRKVFKSAVLPFLNDNSKVLELGPGKGSWTRAILKYIPAGELHTIDFHDLDRFLKPELYDGRLKTIQVTGNNYDAVPDDFFDFFWSFGVLCHNNRDSITEILTASLPKLKHGRVAVHQYGDWEKLEAFGWTRGGIPNDFHDKSDDEIWWPRNNKEQMSQIARHCGWDVVNADLGLVGRDSIILLKKP
jgi:SAM-dependent methyltransferase